MTLVEALSLVDLVNDNPADIHIDRRVLNNTERAGQRQIEIVWIHLQIKIKQSIISIIWIWYHINYYIEVLTKYVFEYDIRWNYRIEF